MHDMKLAVNAIRAHIITEERKQEEGVG